MIPPWLIVVCVLIPLAAVAVAATWRPQRAELAPERLDRNARAALRKHRRAAWLIRRKKTP